MVLHFYLVSHWWTFPAHSWVDFHTCTTTSLHLVYRFYRLTPGSSGSTYCTSLVSLLLTTPTCTARPHTPPASPPPPPYCTTLHRFLTHYLGSYCTHLPTHHVLLTHTRWISTTPHHSLPPGLPAAGSLFYHLHTVLPSLGSFSHCSALTSPHYFYSFLGLVFSPATLSSLHTATTLFFHCLLHCTLFASLTLSCWDVTLHHVSLILFHGGVSLHSLPGRFLRFTPTFTSPGLHTGFLHAPGLLLHHHLPAHLPTPGFIFFPTLDFCTGFTHCLSFYLSLLTPLHHCTGFWFSLHLPAPALHCTLHTLPLPAWVLCTCTHFPSTRSH